jgi:hypothetical protein
MRIESSRALKFPVVCAFVVVVCFGAAANYFAAQQKANDARAEKALLDARKISAELTDKVRGLLLKELEKGGYEGAISVCALVAQDITRQFNEKSGHSVRRISLGYRNPNDFPDEYERQKLESFDRLNREKKLESEYYEVVSEQGREYLRYLKPVVAGKMCLNCHGQPDEIPIGVQRVIQENYPNDRATGYLEGDVRGAVSVKIALPPKAAK